MSKDPTITTGALYAVLGTNPCGACALCTAGRDNICVGTKEDFGLGRDGGEFPFFFPPKFRADGGAKQGFAEYVTASISNVIKVPEGVTAAQASAATDALLTPYHGIKTLAKLQPHENVVVVGLGGVGLNAFKIAKIFGSQVYATDVKVRISFVPIFLIHTFLIADFLALYL